MENKEAYKRLSDKVLEALKLALEQEDVAISEVLNRALEMSLTRGAGGDNFVERREFSEEIEAALDKFEELQRKAL